MLTPPSKTLIFLDPPYYEQGQSLYENHYQPEDHVRLSGVVKNNLTSKWIISYDNHPEIRKAYSGCPKLVYSLGYSAATRYKGSEVMFFSDGLIVPRVKTPLSNVSV
jgi:DNA adenine methylase